MTGSEGVPVRANGPVGCACDDQSHHLHHCEPFMPIPVPLTPTIIEKLEARTARNGQWGAAIFIFTSSRFADDNRVWRHVDHDLSGIDFSAMLRDRSWTPVEKMLLTLAASLYGKSATLNIGRLFELLGHSGRDVVLGAIEVYLAGM